jgi:hypothetical protein
MLYPGLVPATGEHRRDVGDQDQRLLTPPLRLSDDTPDQRAIDINYIGFVYRDVSVGYDHDAMVLQIGQMWRTRPRAFDHTEPAQSSEPNDRHRQFSHTGPRRRFHPI